MRGPRRLALVVLVAVFLGTVATGDARRIGAQTPVTVEKLQCFPNPTLLGRQVTCEAVIAGFPQRVEFSRDPDDANIQEVQPPAPLLGAYAQGYVFRAPGTYGVAVFACDEPVEGPLSMRTPGCTFDAIAVTVQAAAAQTWTGGWDTSWGTMELIQSADSTVTGTYTWDQGRINGRVKGNMLIGTWSEAPTYAPPSDAGDIEFTMSDDGTTFSGCWRYDSTGDMRCDWTGTRK